MKIEFDKLTKGYRKSNGTWHPVLKNVSLSIQPGDFVMLLGKSGCGKTTLLNMLAGFDTPSSGTVRVDGKRVADIHPSRTMLFQQPTLIPWLTVEENVAYGCKIRKDFHQLDYRVAQFIEITGLSGFEHSRPCELSLGMAQRTCLARALVGHPEILIMDEPFASLDTFTRAHIQEETVNLWLSEQFTVVFVTHDIDEAILMGNRVVLLGGSPVGIIETFDIDLPYPRDLNHPLFKGFRREILNRFKRSQSGNRGFL
ncbi:NtrC2 [Desulforapulum autotrophicum HRM2]|uniref:NtrC2 n=1 Tax=Desulforapulum autotrophicum (strain ATCC 43914 / DSM 3382 / VKM B-1955 / HRM2) TaxID=177437 RepID=C0QKV2_DESAH|nr:ABC transporter ATP-binding protein [Desulforapulum autotrophicum]ACN16192.1 NtrC2 [Desulforapulum autotrophicum HRM2]